MSIKKTQKGFTITLVIAVVALLAIGGGAFLYQKMEAPVETDTLQAADDLVARDALSPSIKIISPNGGEVYDMGSTLKIRWTSSGLTTDTRTTGVGINLIDQSGNTIRKLSQGLSNSGLFDWIIKGDEVQGVLQPGKYRIGLYSTGTTGAADQSDSFFTISAQSTTGDEPMTSGSQLFTDPEHGISLKYPATFTRSNQTATVGRFLTLVDSTKLHPNALVHNTIEASAVSAKGEASFSEYIARYPIVSGNSNTPFSFKPRQLGLYTFYYTQTERFEGVLSYSYYLVRNGMVYRFDSFSYGVAWSDRNLDVENDSTHLALKQMLTTLKFD